MTSFPALTASMMGTIVGVVGGGSQLFSEIMQSRAKWVAVHLIFIIVIGGFMSFMGTDRRKPPATCIGQMSWPAPRQRPAPSDPVYY